MKNEQYQKLTDSHNDQATQSKTEADNTILEKISQQTGNIPGPLKLAAMRPGTVAALMAQRNQVFEGGPLSEREQELVALAAVVTLRSAPCIRTHSKKAMKFGASQDEVVQAILIASFMSGTAPLHLAYAGVGEE